MANLSGIPSPPTDSLYKFIAIFGLALVIGGFVLLMDRRDTLLDQIYDHNIRDAAHQVVAKDSEDPKLSQETARLKKEEESLIGEIRVFTGDKCLYYWMIGVGAFISVFGFCAWYWQHQKHQDKIVRRDAMKAQAEIDEITKKGK